MRNKCGSLHNDIKVSHQEDIAILQMCTTNNRTVKYMNQKQMEQKEQINKSKIIILDFNNPVSTMDWLNKHKISNDRRTQKHHQLKRSTLRLWHIPPCNCKTHILYKYHETYTKIEDILGHNRDLNKIKLMEIIQTVVYGHSGIKLDINNR